MEDINFLKERFSKYGIDKFIDLDGKYYDAYIDRIVYDYRVLDKMGYSASKYAASSSFLKKVSFILGGAIVSSFKSKVKKTTLKSNTRIKERVIALPYADIYIRFKYLHKIVDEPLAYYYHPVFHYEKYKLHEDYYAGKDVPCHLGSFSFGAILKALIVILFNFKKLCACSSELDEYFGFNSCHLPRIVIFPLLYKISFHKLLGSLDNPEASRVWLLDYDLDLKYILFNAYIHKGRPGDKTLHIQHGSFFQYEGAYCNPVSDISLCCSAREKELIDKYNKYNSQIEVLGAPLQSFNDKRCQNNEVEIEYDMLVLLTNVCTDERKDVMREFLSGIDYKQYRINIRYRPASRHDDEKVLAPFIGDSHISNGTTLLQDVLASKVVVSFSEDATYQCIRENKRIIVITSESGVLSYDFRHASPNLKIVSSYESYCSIDLKQMIEGYRNCNYNEDEFVRFNFGENSIEGISLRLSNIINDNL